MALGGRGVPELDINRLVLACADAAGRAGYEQLGADHARRERDTPGGVRDLPRDGPSAEGRAVATGGQAAVVGVFALDCLADDCRRAPQRLERK